ncbi:hypothetical protein AOQ84DRAFT_8616 [Glonium stellatum]|uniref:Uncharacterized protein n=1 Tax=Glonium stellatum TaxID=574774 RepID=A0A8E2F3Q5_9PEZI|nr:hypothetical protein AOQ84DRAFT_8616 [Glonium stellatum]
MLPSAVLSLAKLSMTGLTSSLSTATSWRLTRSRTLASLSRIPCPHHPQHRPPFRPPPCPQQPPQQSHSKSGCRGHQRNVRNARPSRQRGSIAGGRCRVGLTRLGGIAGRQCRKRQREGGTSHKPLTRKCLSYGVQAAITPAAAMTTMATGSRFRPAPTMLSCP